MANPKHLAKLQEGVTAWNAWRERDPYIEADLSQANFFRTNLSHAKLSGVILSGAILSGAILSHVNLSITILSGAKLGFGEQWSKKPA